ncbi:NPCBM/NEW2 domain-containing protein [Asticcacaulis sp. YBE204]|uniref:NPCBM/NEW2 domain-containing protein n=1 Tax=Asticcacaulis sp. YBE204 TaxID=1282363 RepID=UPI0003C3D34A|nr:NPCBM/NEW2 domain-containing protein [Asticcacaulis sp. YBE204]ESQ80244.1 hypothetical protein AEYBE204_06385 [Asticcacaulis sp. YBE204]
MKLRWLTTSILAGLSLVLTAHAADDPLSPTGKWTAHQTGQAQTPPMGWNSFNAFRIEVSEDKVMGAAEALVDTGLAKLGYVYVNIDDGWWLKRRQSDGRLEIRTAIFPSAAIKGKDTSFRPFTDKLHSMGLKAGIYSEIGRNACSQAWDLKSPNLPEGTVAEREVGLEGHVDQDLKLFFTDWGFDYIKIDACGVADYTATAKVITTPGYRVREPLIARDRPALDKPEDLKAMYVEVADSLRKYNPDNDYVLSICSWGRADVRTWGKDVGNLWRTSYDINPTWGSMLHSFDSAVTRPLYAGPGRWNDPDMLFVGKGDFDVNHMTEAKSHFALWAMLNAPLLIGYDLRGAPKALIDIWGNADLVAVNQDKGGHQAVLAYRSDDVQILVKTLSNGKTAVALFNRSEAAKTVSLTARDLKFDAAKPVVLRNLWTKDTLPAFTGSQKFTLGAHETLVFEAEGTHRLGQGTYLSEIPGRINVAADGIPFPEGDPHIYQPTRLSAGRGGDTPMYAGWGGAQADASPYGTELTVGEKAFAYGIGILSGSRMEVQANGEYRRFVASVGVDAATRNRKAAVTFQVYGDGRLLAESKPLAYGEAATELTADVAGVKVVELIVQADKDAAVSTVWGDARFDK